MVEPRPVERLSLPPGTLQREALEMLWDAGQSSTLEVADRLSSKLGVDLNYNTVSSALNGLCNMGVATRVRVPTARAYRYSACVSREQLEKAATVEAVQVVFKESGNSRLALSYLVDIIKKTDSRLLDDLKGVVKQKQRVTKLKRGQ